ncbi:MAG: PilT/PilU family type 4a pilus ATPase [Oscillospiraceae bacterium]
MNLIDILKDAVLKEASDVFLVAGRPSAYNINGKIVNADEKTLLTDDCQLLITEIYKLALDRDIKVLKEIGNDDFSFTVKGLSRFRVSAYIQRGSYAAVIRVISFQMPNWQEINVPKEVMDLAEVKKGLVLVTGTAGSGKSTTLACIIDRINKTETKHIITLEDPIEYLHSHKKSIVSQREIGSDTTDYLTALKSSLRQHPDVILLGEMRDIETISIALTTAETGHTIYSTLHTLGASKTIDRIVDVFPAQQRQQIAIQLSMLLEAVVSQQLLPTIDGKLILATEVMRVTPAIRNLIREGKIHQIDNVINSSQDSNMISMDARILSLYKSNIISQETAIMYSTNVELMQKRIASIN